MTRCACGAEAASGDVFCQACGRRLPQPTSPETSTSHGVPDHAPSLGIGIGRCQACGAEVESGWQFCGVCGAPAGGSSSDETDQVAAESSSGGTCRQCGSSLEPESAFCGACGARVETPAPLASPPAASGQATGGIPMVTTPVTAHDNRRAGKGRWVAFGVLAVVLALTAVALVVFVGLPLLRGDDDSQEATASATDEPTATVAPQPTETAFPVQPTPESTSGTADPTQSAGPGPAEIPAGFKSCGAATAGDAVFANEVTSCPFALNVANAWGVAIDPSLLTDVPSPVTGETYDMRCSGSGPALCEGGNDAAVLIYP